MHVNMQKVEEMRYQGAVLQHAEMQDISANAKKHGRVFRSIAYMILKRRTIKHKSTITIGFIRKSLDKSCKDGYINVGFVKTM